jgi:hypothetical protein
VEPFRENATTPIQANVQTLRDANGKSLNPAREAPSIARLRYQMQVVALHRKMGDAEVLMVERNRVGQVE